MSDTDDKEPGAFTTGAASQAPVSLSQAILAPLDAIFKAQVHGARSFLSLVLQMGFKDEDEVNEKGTLDELHTLEFPFRTASENGKVKTGSLRIPQLAVVPIAPLAVEDAEFELDFTVSHIQRHGQMQLDRIKKEAARGENDLDNPTGRPWYLVKEPISVRGVMAPSSDNVKKAQGGGEESKIKIKIKVGKQAMPAALDKMLTSLTEIVELPIEENNQNP